MSSAGGNGFGTRTFWTAAIDDSDVQVHLGAGTAELSVSNLTMDDYGKIPIALGPNWQTAFAPATVSFDVVWSGPITREVTVTNGTNGDQFAGDYMENQATVTWSGTNLATGFSFTANPGDFSTTVPGRAFAEIGHEGNGSFFQSDSSAQGDNSAAALLATQASSALAGPGANLAPQLVVGVRARGGTDLGYHDYLGVGQGQPLTAPASVLSSHSQARMAARAAQDRVFELASGSAESWTKPFTDIGP